MLRIFLLSLCILLTAGTYTAAQSLLYPVRINHQWGVASLSLKRGSSVKKQPSYDVISEIPLPWHQPVAQPAGKLAAAEQADSTELNSSSLSPFRYFERNGKLGLLDKDLNERLPAQYQVILPLTFRYFAVKKPGDSLFTIIDSTAKVVVSATYADVAPLNPAANGETKYFMVRSGQLWGIHKKGGNLVLPAKYALIQTAFRTDFFKIKTSPADTAWRIVNIDGQAVLPDAVHDAYVLHPKLVVEKYIGKVDRGLARRDTSFLYRLYQGGKKHPKTWSAFIPLNPHLAVIYAADTGQLLLRTANQTILPKPKTAKPIRRYYALDNSFIVGMAKMDDSQSDKNAKLWSAILIDSTGTPVPNFEADSIKSTGITNAFFVKQGRFWSIRQLTPDKKFKTIFENRFVLVKQLKNDLIVCSDSVGYGVLNKQFKEIVPFKYSKIEFLNEEIIRAYTASHKITDYYLVSGGEDGSADGKTKAAMPLREKQVLPIPTSGIQSRSTVQPRRTDKNSFRYWRLDAKKRRWIYAGRPTEDSLSLGADFVDLLPTEPAVQNQSSAAVYLKTTSYSNPALPFGKCARMLFFDFAKQKLAGPPMLGFRAFEPGVTYTAFVDSSGRMGLIDRTGNELKRSDGSPVRYSYVGPFRCGRARVCLGGKLTVVTKEGHTRFGIQEQNAFFAEFNLRETGWQIRPYVQDPQQVFVATIKNQTAPKWGFIDEKGNVVLEPQYDYVEDYHPQDSIALVAMKSKRNQLNYGAVDLKNKTVYQPVYSGITRYAGYFKLEADSTPLYYFSSTGKQLMVTTEKPGGFSENRCPVKCTNGKWGFIDSTGTTVIACRFDTVRAFSNGMAAVVDSTGFWSFINPKGTIIFSTPMLKSSGRDLGNFYDNRCRFRLDKRWGYYNKKGEVAIASDFNTRATDFNRGYAALVRIDSTRKVYPAIMDTAGNYFFLPEFVRIEEFDDLGLARARYPKSRSNSWVWINPKGRPITPEYDSITPFVNGFSRVRKGALWGMVNRNGKLCLTTVYNAIDTMSENIVGVKVGDKWKFVDSLGRPVFNGSYSRISRFQSGVALVNERDIINKRGEILKAKEGRLLFFSEGISGVQVAKNTVYFLDERGENIFKAGFGAAKPFNRGAAAVRTQDEALWGIINKRGMLLTPAKYRIINPQFDGNYTAYPERRYGLGNSKGKILLPLEYDRIMPLSRGNFRVERGEEVGYIDKNGNWLWKLQK